MKNYQPQLTAVLQQLDETWAIGELLMLPEYAVLGENPADVVAGLERWARELLTETPAAALRHRHRPESPEVRSVSVPLDPPKQRRSPTCWQQPVAMSFWALVWRQAPDAWVAAVPALGIEVLAERRDDLDRLLPAHIRFALMRDKRAASLEGLIELERFGEIRLRELSPTIPRLTPKQQAIADAKGDSNARPELAVVADDWAKLATSRRWSAVFELDDIAAAVADALTGKPTRSVLLVGSSGVGKTAAVRQLVARRGFYGLGDTGFFASSGSRLVAGMSGFGMWQERCAKICREAAEANAILYLGNLVELLDVGKSIHNSQGIGAFLRPYLARGDLRVVVEATTEQLPLLERQDPHLLAVFARVEVPEPSPEKTRGILLSRAVEAAGRLASDQPPITDEGLATLDRLHRRYATYSASPGRQLRFLDNLLADHPGFSDWGWGAGQTDTSAETPESVDSLSGSSTDRVSETPNAQPLQPPQPPSPRPQTPFAAVGESEVLTAFARETGLPMFLLDPAVPMDLAETRRFFAERVIGQEEAVDLIVDLLATVKAGLTRPRKPIASLMFIGPTGVGKTEMAKSLAEFLFGDRTRLTRFDMSEYADPVAVTRLIGGVFGAEGLLTARVREQPFSVVLLDEFEKADPGLLDLMLQVFGEGRLTDAGGRVADFRNAVVILTSNLGAESYMQGPGGFVRDPAAARDAKRHFVEAVRDAVRPELFNRIDRIVPFAPLGRKTVADIARRELELISRRDGLRFRQVQLSVSESAADRLAATGFHALYGARPLKRAVERQLLAPLAAELITYPDTLPLTVSVRDADAGLSVEVRARRNTATGEDARADSLAKIAGDCMVLRRQIQRLRRRPVMMELSNELFNAERAARAEANRWMRHQRKGPDLSSARPEFWTEAHTLAEQLRDLRETLMALEARAVELETRVLLLVYDDRMDAAGRMSEAQRAAIRAELPSRRQLAEEWDALLLRLYVRNLRQPDEILLGLFGDERAELFELAAGYADVAARTGATVAVTAYLAGQQNRRDAVVIWAVTTGSLPATAFINREPVLALLAKPDLDARLRETVEGVIARPPPRVKELLDSRKLADAADFLSRPMDDVLGLALTIRGPAARPRFEHEHGLHLFKGAKKPHRVLVQAFDGEPTKFVPPAGIEARGGLPMLGDNRRLYTGSRGSGAIQDVELSESFARTPEGLADAIAARLSRELRELLEDEE